MIDKSDFRAFNCEFRRSGNTGQPFYFCRFKYLKGGNLNDMTAIVFTTPGYCAVMSGNGEQWRGDLFEKAIRDAIVAVEKTAGRKAS